MTCHFCGNLEPVDNLDNISTQILVIYFIYLNKIVDKRYPGYSPDWIILYARDSMSAVTCLVFNKYCMTYTLGAKNIIVCSPQPIGMRRRLSKPPDIKVVTTGPIRFPWREQITFCFLNGNIGGTCFLVFVYQTDYVNTLGTTKDSKRFLFISVTVK